MLHFSVKRSITEFTALLQRARVGDAQASRDVFEVVYEDLRRAAHAINAVGGGRTLQPTALVHEAWFKLAPHIDRMNSRLHFLAVASHAMRQVLADHARARRCDKRGGAWAEVELDENLSAPGDVDADLLDLHERIEQLERLNERHARVVEMRVFAGMRVTEVAEALGVSCDTVESDWSMARAWLIRRRQAE